MLDLLARACCGILLRVGVILGVCVYCWFGVLYVLYRLSWLVLGGFVDFGWFVCFLIFRCGYYG